MEKFDLKIQRWFTYERLTDPSPSNSPWATAPHASQTTTVMDLCVLWHSWVIVWECPKVRRGAGCPYTKRLKKPIRKTLVPLFLCLADCKLNLTVGHGNQRSSTSLSVKGFLGWCFIISRSIQRIMTVSREMGTTARTKRREKLSSKILPAACSETSCKVPLHWLYEHQSQAPMGATWTCLTRGRAHPTASGSPRTWETAAGKAWEMAWGVRSTAGAAATATRRLINESTPIDSFWLNLIISLLFDPVCISSEQGLSCLVIDKDHQWEWHRE